MGAQRAEQMFTQATHCPQGHPLPTVLVLQIFRETEAGPRNLSAVPSMYSSSHKIYEVYDVSLFCDGFFKQTLN